MIAIEPLFYSIAFTPVILWSCDNLNRMTHTSHTAWWERIGFVLVSTGAIGNVVEWWWSGDLGGYSTNMLFVAGLGLLTTGFLFRRSSR